LGIISIVGLDSITGILLAKGGGVVLLTVVKDGLGAGLVVPPNVVTDTENKGLKMGALAAVMSSEDAEVDTSNEALVNNSRGEALLPEIDNSLERFSTT
jgi:hypothetical protein